MGWWSRQSLSVKLPAALALIFVAACAAMSAAMFVEVRATVLGAASERLDQAARQMSEVLATSARQRLALAQALARSDDLLASLTSSSPELPAETQKRLLAYLGAAAATGSVEIWGPTGERRLAVGLSLAPLDADRRQAILAASAPRLSSLWEEGAAVNYTASVPMREHDRVVGFLVERRHLANQSQTVALLSGLVGSDASILVGNRDGSQWTDLSRPVTIGVSERDGDRLLDYERPGRPRVLARAVPVPETPWMAVVELPFAPVLTPVDRLFRRAIALALTLLAVIAILGWAALRHVTAPLRSVTAAAQEIAEGRPSPHLERRADDEIGRLVDCFNLMARRVEESRQRNETLVSELEERVERRTAALQEANRELEAFTYSVSHDLRAPLRAIAGFARILSEDAREHLPPESQGTLEVIERNTRHMGMLIDDLLTFSRLSRQPVNAAPVDMAALAANVAEEIQRSEAEGRHLVFELGALPPAVGDRALLRQVFVNLLQNAAKFTRTRPDAVITVGATAQPDATAYFVRDNGVGFDMQYADKLFGVFQRLHRAEDFEGTGVGLALVQRIVHRHRGRVWAEALVDQGATFTFTLPRVRTEP